MTGSVLISGIDYNGLIICIMVYSATKICMINMNLIMKPSWRRNVAIPHMMFMKRCFLAQLFYNSSYEYFYKVWRYYRLLIIGVRQYGKNYDDRDIVAAMRKYKHYDMLMSFFGIPGVQRLSCQSLFPWTAFRVELAYIYSIALMVENFESICISLPEKLINLDAEGKTILKRLIRHVDFRDVSTNLFKTYLPSIRKDRFGCSKKRGIFLIGHFFCYVGGIIAKP